MKRLIKAVREYFVNYFRKLSNSYAKCKKRLADISENSSKTSKQISKHKERRNR